MWPVILNLGPITVYSFGAMMALGFYLGTEFAAREYARRGGDAEKLWSYLLWVFVAGVVSSRVLSIFNDIPGFIENPAVAFAGSGFVWYGGFLGGVGTAYVLGRRRGIPFGVAAECAALGLALGQAIGRIGCHLAGDGDWGVVTDLPWGVAYEFAIIGWPHEPGVMVHPTPLYETIAYLGVFALCLTLARRDPPLGTVFGTYLVGTSVSRFLVEFIRINPVVALGLTQAQWIAIGLFVLGAVLLARALAPGKTSVATTAAVTVALLAIASGCTRGGGPGVGDLAPDFVLRSADGEVRKLSNFRGRPVLVNLWATWCPPCIREMPLLDQIADDYGERGLVVLGVAGDDDTERVTEFLADRPVRFEVLLDPDGAVGTEYGITGYPETFLVDREGRLAGKFIGPVPAEGGRPAPSFLERLDALVGA